MYQAATSESLANAIAAAKAERDRAKFQLVWQTTPPASWLASSVDLARAAKADVEKWDRVLAAYTAPVDEAKAAYLVAVADACAIEALIPQALNDADRLTLQARHVAARLAAAEVLLALRHRIDHPAASCNDAASVTGGLTVAGALGTSPGLAIGALALLGGAIYLATRKAMP